MGRFRLVVAALAAVVVSACSSSTTGSTDPPTPEPTFTAAPGAPSPGAAVASPSWPGYHADNARTGAVPGVASLSRLGRAWTANLGAAVRGQPVIDDGRIVAATEGNRVVGLDPASGDVLWSASLGAPLTDIDHVIGCGNISPLGITSTPVVDTATHTVYVVGEVSDGGGRVHHQLAGFDVRTGARTLSREVDPPLPAGESAVTLLQRASLALANGRVYISYGGNSGDCGLYHGWIVGTRITGAADTVSFEVARDGAGGAIWEGGGAPAVDPAGNLYLSTGNANPDPPQGGPDPKKYTESVVKLTPRLQPLASYKDRVAGGDEDLATGNPVLLPDGEVFSVGKTDIAFVLRRSDLSLVAAIHGVCGSDPDGGPAYDRSRDVMFVPCRAGGIQVVHVRKHTLGPRLAGADSAPVLVGSTVWALDSTRGTLAGYRAADGSVSQTVRVGAEVPVFSSPSVGLGLLLVATTSGVTAFR